MAGRLAEQLHDPLAQVAIDDLNAVVFEKRVQMAFLGEHRLALDHPAGIVSLENVEHDLVVLVGVAGPMHHGAQTRGVGLELFEILGQPALGMGLDSRSSLAERFPFGQGESGAIALASGRPQGLVVPGGAGGVAQEGGGFGGVVHTGRPARISAMCITRSGILRRRINPSRCIRHDISLAVSTWAPACW